MKQNSNEVTRPLLRIPLIVRAIVTGFVVSTIGIIIWSALFKMVPAPWCIIPMTAVLWLYVKFFSGSFGSAIKKDKRKFNFRSTRLTILTWKRGILAAILFVIIVQASFVITFRLVYFPGEKFTADYHELDQMPIGLAWAVLIMGSIVAGVCEETGFRGYMQVPLEEKYGPIVAIIITSIIFMLIHLSHSWARPILPHIFFASVLLGIIAYKTGSLIPGIIGHSILDIFDYSIWWSNITGGFKRQTIFITGIDIHFVTWVLVFILSLFLFFRSIKYIKKPNELHIIDKTIAQ